MKVFQNSSSLSLLLLQKVQDDLSDELQQRHIDHPPKFVALLNVLRVPQKEIARSAGQSPSGIWKSDQAIDIVILYTAICDLVSQIKTITLDRKVPRDRSMSQCQLQVKIQISF